jgi:Asp-tRNA(Asn)/Glu-tRNA(Gln) amidotransferase A subunit family amidase
MDADHHRELAQALRARLAAAGLEPPSGEDAHRLERDLALHLERVADVMAAADLGPTDPPLTDPTRGAAAGSGAAEGGAVDSRHPAPGRWATLPEGAPIAAAEGEVGPGEGGARPAGGLGEQARRIRDGEATSAELVEQALERIGLLDGRLGAFVLVLGERARAEAQERDAARRRGRVAGPLHGVPVAVKDLIDVGGEVTAAGSPKLAANLAAADAEVVARLRRAGAVVVGKTRTHEFAYGVTTPGTANPWDLGRIAGGSSGGSAAAVAGGLVAGAVGSDTAGSIRIPSACCGVVGLKPTWGRVPATGVWPLSWSCDHVGPIAGSVADATLVDRVLAGDTGDPGTVDEVSLPLKAARGAVAAIVLAEAAAAHAELLARTGAQGYSRAMLAMIRIGRSALAGEYLTGLRYRGRFVAEVEGLLAGRDALLLPTLPCVAPATGQRTIVLDGTEVGVQAALTRLPGPFNCSGSPVLSLPAGAVGGLPVGVSLVGRIGGDRRLLAVAAWAEALAPPVGRPALGP